MVLLNKILQKLVFRKVYLGEMSEEFLNLRCWLSLSESVVEGVCVCVCKNLCTLNSSAATTEGVLDLKVSYDMGWKK